MQLTGHDRTNQNAAKSNFPHRRLSPRIHQHPSDAIIEGIHYCGHSGHTSFLVIRCRASSIGNPHAFAAAIDPWPRPSPGLAHKPRPAFRGRSRRAARLPNGGGLPK